MARYWRSFETQEEQKKWEQSEIDDTEDGRYFHVCMRMMGKQLIDDLPHLKGGVSDKAFVTVYAYYSKKWWEEEK